MQLSVISQINDEPSMVVDYFPIEGTTEFIYKVVKFQGMNTVSTKCITRSDFEYELRERMGLGWKVTRLNAETVNVNYMAGAC